MSQNCCCYSFSYSLPSHSVLGSFVAQFRNIDDYEQPEQPFFRIVLVVIGMALITLLFTARQLTPSEYGFGTHQQLGLPPCGMMMAFGLPCPSCGMTTSWALLMRGNIIQAAYTNMGGTLLGILAMVLGPWAVITGIRGRWLFLPPEYRITIGVGVLIVLVTFAQWVYRLTN